jgi:hypothetical protein
MSEQRAERCATCRFWKDNRNAPAAPESVVRFIAERDRRDPEEVQEELDQQGRACECHRYPRQTHWHPAGVVHANFPETQESDWCGEWQPNGSAVRREPLPLSQVLRLHGFKGRADTARVEKILNLMADGYTDDEVRRIVKANRNNKQIANRIEFARRLYVSGEWQPKPRP